jgi:DNA topoisomerase-1
VIKAVASRLGNTPAICRRCYVHPAVIESFLADGLLDTPRIRGSPLLTADEARLLAFLQRKARRPRNAKSKPA